MATFVAASLAALGFAGLAWQRRRTTPGGGWLVVLLVAVAQILMMYGLSYGAAFDTRTRLSLIDATYVGWLVASPTLLLYVVRVTGRSSWLQRPWSWCVLIGMPLAFVPVIWGPRAATVFFGGGRSALTYDFPSSSPLYWVFIAYTYALLAFAAVIIIRTARSTPRLHPAQSRLLIAIVLIPWFFSFGSFVNIRVFGADPTVLSLLICGVLAFSVTQFTMFDLRPMTEAEAQLASDAGVVVVDRQGRLSEMNATAARLLGPGVSPAMGLQLEQIWATEPAIVAALHGADLGGISIPNAHGDGLLSFEYTSIVEANGRESGTLILIREREGASGE
jgi:PAS domain-containing protein